MWLYVLFSSTTSVVTAISAIDQAECFIRRIGLIAIDQAECFMRIGLMVTWGRLDLVWFYVVC